MRRKILGICLAIIFIFSVPFYSFADADLDNPPTEPTKPKVENYKDNNKIKEYNEEVKDYNEQAKEYNQAVDEEYNTAVKDIDEQNKLEQERVDKVNEEKQKQYDIEKEQYDKDKAFEERVLADPRYDSLDQYNEAVKNYNDYVERYNISVKNYHIALGVDEESVNNSVQRNTNAPKVTITDTYTIIEAENKSGRMIPVHLEHNFPAANIFNSIDFEIDANDTIIFYGVAPKSDAINDVSCLFFYNTDSNHTYGVWSNSFSILQEYPTADVVTDWKNGDTHQISYANSTNEYYWSFEDISMVYEYQWTSFYELKTPFEYANIPVMPVLDLEVFNALSYPEKRAYLEYLSYLSLFDKPIIKNNTPSIINHVITEDNYVQTKVVQNNDPPRSIIQQEGSWALINLIATLLTFLITIILLIFALINKRKESDELEIKNRMLGRIISIVVAIVTGFVFLITEDMTLPMVLVDQWTLIMIAFLTLQLIIMILCKHKEIETE